MAELNDFLRLRSATAPKQISGSTDFSFISNASGMPSLWRSREDGTTAEWIAIPDRVMTVQHSPRGDRTLITADTGGDEREQLYILAHDTEAVRELVISPEYFHNPGGWSPDGTRIALSSNRRTLGDFDVFVVDVDSGEMTTVFEYDGRCDPITWVDDDTLLISLSVSNLEKSIVRLTISTGATANIAPDAPAGRFQAVKLNKDKDVVYALRDSAQGFLEVQSFPLADPAQLRTVVGRENRDISGFALSPDGNVIAVNINDEGYSALVLVDLATGAETRVEDIPRGVVSGITWVEDDLRFSLITPSTEHDIWKHSRSAAASTQLTHVGSDETVQAACVEPSLEEFASYDGLTVPYFYYAAAGTDPSPVLIYVHGGPEGQSRAEFHPMLQYLASHGVSVAVPNVRGSDGYGRAYLALDDVTKRMDSIKDLESLARHLAETGRADDSRIGIMGRSYGGFAVLAALTNSPELWAAGIDIVGPSDFRTLLRDTGVWRRYLREAEYGDRHEHEEFFATFAPRQRAERITAPLIVFHGANDSRVPPTESQWMVEKLGELGQTVDHIVFDNEGHQTVRPENNEVMFSRSTDHLLDAFDAV